MQTQSSSTFPTRASIPIPQISLIALVLFIGFSDGWALTDADLVCDSLSRQLRTQLVDEVGRAADETFCRKPWIERTSREFLACAGAKQSIRIESRLRDRWNRLFQTVGKEWATWGPRTVADDWETGTILAGFKRTYFGVILPMGQTRITIEKRGGKAETIVTVCEFDRAGNLTDSHRRKFTQGAHDSIQRDVTFAKQRDPRILATVLDTKFGVNQFRYRIRLQTDPDQDTQTPVNGIADLHVHQTANLAFGGRMMWGQHDGIAENALAPEIMTTELPDELGKIRLSLNGLDANILLAHQGRIASDEGFYRLGGGGFPNYKSWPHHADRSHQQVYIDWLYEAVNRNRDRGENLGLMVLSLVNNDILCRAFKAIDPKGNVPRWNGTGEIDGWESAPWACEDDANIKRQIEAVHAMERKYPWFRIALSPWHARQIIKDGDLAVVISVETDKPLSGAGGKYGNWEQQLDRYRALGITTMQIVHESNSIFCGASQHREIMQVLQTLRWPVASIPQLLSDGNSFDLDEQGRNRLGITTEGKKLIAALVQRRMPIDLAHASIRCRRDIMQTIPKNYALYDSHTKFERLLHPAAGQTDYGSRVLDREKTFLIPTDLEQEYINHQVLIGLRTASVDVYDAPNNRVANNCPGSANSFAQLVQYAHDRGFTFAYGSDFNTGVSQLGPRFGAGRCYASSRILGNSIGSHRLVAKEPPLPRRALSINPIAGTNYYLDGLATIGWLPELTRDLIELGTPGARQLTDGAEAYLRMWERAYQ